MPQADLKCTITCVCSICGGEGTMFVGHYDPGALQVAVAVDRCIPSSWQLLANRKIGTLLVCNKHDVELVICESGSGKYSQNLVTGKSEKQPLPKAQLAPEKKKK